MNLRRCYLEAGPSLPALPVPLVGRKMDRRFYFRRLLPGALKGRAACAYALLRNSFSGKRGSFARQQQPLPPSCARRRGAAPGRAGLSARPARRPGSLPRSHHELPRRKGAGPRPGLRLRTARRTFCKRPALRRERQRRAGGPRALQQGRIHHD